MGNELLWFKSYISNRKQFCRVNGAYSKLSPINIGVPQGSCLGPLLFLVYINDLSRVVNHGSVAMLADDTSLSFRAKNLRKLNDALNSDLANLDDWLMGNKLSHCFEHQKGHLCMQFVKPFQGDDLSCY